MTSLFLASTGSGWAVPATDQELAARFPYDLGPATIDVSQYPSRQRENYQLFLQKCSVCHTPARPINSPLVLRQDWSRFVRRMHIRSKEVLLRKDEASRIIDFLAYGSKIRKIDHKTEFDELQDQLKRRFEEVQKEKASRSEHLKTKEPPPYTGTP